NYPIIPHENAGAEDCWGCLVPKIDGEQVRLVCNECGAVAATIQGTTGGWICARGVALHPSNHSAVSTLRSRSDGSWLLVRRCVYLFRVWPWRLNRAFDPVSTLWALTPASALRSQRN